MNRRSGRDLGAPSKPNEVGSDAAFMRLAGAIFAAAEEYEGDSRFEALSEAAIGELTGDPSSFKQMLIELAKNSAAAQQGHRPANPFLEKMIHNRTAASVPQPQSNPQFNELAKQILERLDNGSGNPSIDSPVDPSAGRQSHSPLE